MNRGWKTIVSYQLAAVHKAFSYKGKSKATEGQCLRFSLLMLTGVSGIWVLANSLHHIQTSEGLCLSAVLKATVRTPLTGPPSTSSSFSPSLLAGCGRTLRGPQSSVRHKCKWPKRAGSARLSEGYEQTGKWGCRTPRT